MPASVIAWAGEFVHKHSRRSAEWQLDGSAVELLSKVTAQRTRATGQIAPAADHGRPRNHAPLRRQPDDDVHRTSVPAALWRAARRGSRRWSSFSIRVARRRHRGLAGAESRLRNVVNPPPGDREAMSKASPLLPGREELRPASSRRWIYARVLARCGRDVMACCPRAESTAHRLVRSQPAPCGLAVGCPGDRPAGSSRINGRDMPGWLPAADPG